MCEKENSKEPKKSKEEIKIIVINKPTKEEADKKIEELCEFLKKTWFLPLKIFYKFL